MSDSPEAASGSLQYIGIPGTGGGTGGGVGIPGTGENSEVHNVLIPASASGWGAFAEGQGVASGFLSHAEGSALATANNAHAEGGSGSEANGDYSHAEGLGVANGDGSHAEGSSRTGAGATDAHAEGTNNDADGSASHAEGSATNATGYSSHAEGATTTASGDASHAEGEGTTASGDRSHAEGQNTQAIGDRSHAEGNETIASGEAAHAEGELTVASGFAAHAEGVQNSAGGNYSHAGGLGNTAHFGQVVLGSYAVDDNISNAVPTANQKVFKLGGGTSDSSRRDIFSVDENGAVLAPFIRSGKANRNAAYKIHGGAKNSSSLDITNAAYSFSEQHVALSEFWKYRVFVMNHDTVTKTMGIAKVAGSPTDMNAGNTLSWQTQQIAGVDTSNVIIPAATFVSPLDLDNDDISPALFGLDPVLASPTARTDGGTAPDFGAFPLMLSRTLWINGVRPLSALDPDWRTKTGLLFKATGSSYDFVTGNNAAAPTNAYLYQTTFIEFSYVKPTLSGLTLGDSTNTGVGTTSGRFAPIDEAARIARINATNRILIPLKMASSGRRSAGNIGLLNSVIAAGLRPDFCLIPFWTVNDGSNPAQFATSRANAFRCIDICEQNGIIPILLTPPPYNGIGVNLPSWLAARAEVLDMASQMLVCDMVKNICDVSTAQYLPGMSGDGTHFNDTSTPIAGAEVFTTVQQLL